ncbi:RNA-binding protein 44 [Apteryx mantelli]|uniref:Receptor activity-modifying protein 1 n=1 Tax=Apteryx mantelli TaxID=2696672 RepID=A0ABM4EPT4_9AVES
MELEKNSSVKSKTGLLSYSEEDEHALVRDLAAEVNHSGFDQACSINASELKSSEESLPYLSSSSDADIEMYNKERTTICCACGDESEKEAGMLGRACNDMRFICRVSEGYRQSDLGEDSQLEYLSADEQDYCDRNSSSEFCKQMKTVGIKTLKLVDPVHEVPGNGATEEQNLVSLLEDCSPICKYCISDQLCIDAAAPEIHQVLEDCLSLPAYEDVSCDHEEEQTEYHSVLYESALESHTCGSKEEVCPNAFIHDSSENEKVEDNPLIDGTQSTKMAVNEKPVKKNDRHIPSISVKRENPSFSARERSPAVATEFCKSAGETNCYRCDGSVACALGTGCAGCARKDVKTQCPVPEIHSRENPLFGLEVVDKAGGNTSYLNLELECQATLNNVTSDSKVTVNQTVDASSDFRACFTTSRATSAQACLVSRAINTEITMMNKSRPVEWRRESCADVACNTDWSFGSTEEIWSQFTDILEKYLDGNTATAESSQIQDLWKSQNELCSSDLKMSADRPLHLDKKPVKSSASSCCRKILHRAIEADLQLLNIHYRMCCHHCLKIYKLIMEEEKCFIRCNKNGFANAELNSSLLLVLEELGKNYESMKKKIEMGIPLNALPPLSVETKLFPGFSSYIPCKVYRGDLCYDSTLGARKTNFEEPKLQEMKTSVDVDKPQAVCLTDGGQPRHCTSSKTFEDHHKDQDVEYDCRKNEEVNEYWFDAKEKLTATDFSVTFDEKQQEKQDADDSKEVKIMESANEWFFILVGGLSSSVSEDDLRSHFQKYQASDILICADSANYRYAFLCFKEANKAKLAAEEMNRKEIKGKTVSVELVKNASEIRSSVSQNLSNKLWYEIQSINNSQKNVQDKTFTSASNSVKASAATSAAEKVLLLPTTSSEITHATQVPSKMNCLDLKSPTEGSEHCLIGVNQQDTGENSLQKSSAHFFPDPSDTFIPPNTLNLNSFTKLMKKLQEIHPEHSRENIIDALLEVRTNNKGILSGLSINTIVRRTSLILRKSMPKRGGEKESPPPRPRPPPPGGAAVLRPRRWLRSAALRAAARAQEAAARGAARALPMGCGRPAALRMALLPRRFLCFVLAHHFIVATACHEADYGQLIRDYCLSQFQASMEALGPRLWCDWEETLG